MANLTNYLEEALLDHVLRNDSYTSPSEVYVGLVEDTVVEADLEEGNLGNIPEVAVDREVATFENQGQIEGKATFRNLESIEFEDMPDCVVSHAILVDAANDGNVLAWSELDSPRNVNDGDIFRFPQGDLTVTLD